MRRAIMICDLARRADPRGVSVRDPNLWRPVSYTTRQFSGVMLGCGTGPRPVPVAIRLNAQGRYRIWAALYSFVQSAALRLRLSGDIAARELAAPAAYRGKIGRDGVCLYEVFFREADVTGQTLVVEPTYREEDERYLGALAYLRLEPVAAPPRVRRKIVQHPMVLTNDGHGIFELRPHRRPQDLLETFEPIPADSGMRTLLWGIGDGDICNYPTHVGNYFPTSDRFASRPLRTFTANMALWRKNGWNSLRVMRDYAARRKWEFQAYIRVGAFVCPYPFHFLLRSRFFQRHPAWWCRDREGRAVTRLSYAFPSVQAHMAALVKELAGYQLDGVCLAFVRGVPLLLYEDPVVAGFKRRYGVDPRRVSEDDPRWWAYQASVVTAFVEQAKTALRLGQRLSVIVPGNERDCLRWGLDVAEWIRRGLVDDVHVTGQRFDETDVHRDDPKSLDFDYFRRLEGRARVRLMPMLYPWETFGGNYPAWRAALRSCLRRGADGYTVWDGSTLAGQEAFTKLEVGFQGSAPVSPKPPRGRRVPLISVDGFRIDRYHYFETT